MSRVRIVQLLCPARHCIVASAYQSEDGECDPAYPLKLLESFRHSGGEHRCGICGSTDLHTEDRPTRWATLAEAEPILRAEEAKQALSRAVIDRIKSAVKN